MLVVPFPHLSAIPPLPPSLSVPQCVIVQPTLNRIVNKVPGSIQCGSIVSPCGLLSNPPLPLVCQKNTVSPRAFIRSLAGYINA